MDVTGAETRCTTLNNKAAHTIFGACPDDGDIRYAAIGNPHLGTIQNIAVAISSRRGTHTAGVATGIRLGQAKTPYYFTLSHLWQPPLLLFFRTKSGDGKHGERALNRDERA